MIIVEQMLLMLIGHDIQDIDTVLMSTLLICDTVVTAQGTTSLDTTK